MLSSDWLVQDPSGGEVVSGSPAYTAMAADSFTLTRWNNTGTILLHIGCSMLLSDMKISTTAVLGI